jgi:hypothetical protein
MISSLGVFDPRFLLAGISDPDILGVQSGLCKLFRLIGVEWTAGFVWGGLSGAITTKVSLSGPDFRFTENCRGDRNRSCFITGPRIKIETLSEGDPSPGHPDDTPVAHDGCRSLDGKVSCPTPWTVALKNPVFPVTPGVVPIKNLVSGADPFRSLPSSSPFFPRPGMCAITPF